MKDIFNLNPKLLFLLDSIGAALTALILIVLSKFFHQNLGLSSSTYKLLISCALLLLMFSGACYLFLKQNFRPFIKAICFANLSYCILTSTVLLFYNSLITGFELLYFSLEIAIVLALVYIEWTVANAIKK